MSGQAGAAKRQIKDRDSKTGDLPGEVRRAIQAGDLENPMWYAGRLGPSVSDVLHAEGEELAEYKRVAKAEVDAWNANAGPNGNGRTVNGYTVNGGGGAKV